MRGTINSRHLVQCKNGRATVAIAAQPVCAPRAYALRVCGARHAHECARTRASGSADSPAAGSRDSGWLAPLTAGRRAGAAASALCAALLYVAAPGSVLADAAVVGDDFVLPYAEPVVKGESSDRAVSLAARLRSSGARMFGAFWCSHW